MRMSLLGYVTLGLMAFLTFVSLMGNFQVKTLLTAVPMLLALLLIPILLTEMNRRHMERVDVRGIRKYRISDLIRMDVGDRVRIEGDVSKVSFKWLNRPHLELQDGAHRAKVILFTAPRESIRVGDRVEAIGALAKLGFSKEKKIWGVRVRKVSVRTQN